MVNLPMEWGFYAANAESPHCAWQEFEQAVLACGFSSVSVLMDWQCFDLSFPPDDNMLGQMISQEFHRYCRSDGGLECDTSFRVAAASSMGQECWLDLDKILEGEALTPHEKAIVELMRSFGMRAGWTFSVLDRTTRTYSAMLFDSDESPETFFRRSEQHKRWVQSSFVYFREGLAVSRLKRHAGSNNRNILSPRELDTLSWVTAGKSGKEIAGILKLSESTTAEYIASASRKLGASNRTQAAARAMLMGVVNP